MSGVRLWIEKPFRNFIHEVAQEFGEADPTAHSLFAESFQLVITEPSEIDGRKSV